MLSHYYLTILVIVPCVLVYGFPGQGQNQGDGDQDEDVMAGQVPVKNTRAMFLDNMTLELIDLSENRGCHGAECDSKGDNVNYRSRSRSSRRYRGGDDDGDEGDYSICAQPRRAGHCGGRKIRWYYNKRDASCRRFRYSGCGGNANNFRSRRRCEEECSEYDDAGYDGRDYDY